jgi:hypothetical protein
VFKIEKLMGLMFRELPGIVKMATGTMLGGKVAITITAHCS